MKKSRHYLISGGGTGGHIFPAVSIANQLKIMDPECEILFIGAKSRMEMERVPAAGYRIIGLPVRGISRKKLWCNVPVLFDFMRSMLKMRGILRQFKPEVCIGVGGFASGAALRVAAAFHLPILLQEQNGFAGMTNKMLSKYASKICVAYEHMDRYFPKDKIIITGNPVRQNLLNGSKAEGLKFYGFSNDKPVLLIVGGSNGARQINKSVLNKIEVLKASGVQVLWQVGTLYSQEVHKLTEQLEDSSFIVTDFIARMDLAYAMADLVVSRAGASSISEMCLLGKPVILVPSPNVTEDHQTHNAMALVEKDAAIHIADRDAEEELIPQALALLANKERLSTLSKNILLLAQPDSAKHIAQEVLKLVKA